VRREPTSQVAGDVEFTFKHMLIREVAYATVARAPRRQRHAAVARYVEETIEGSSETLAWVLAYHWREAGEPARAIPYLLAEAEAAFRGWAQGAVADLYTAALELAEDEELRRRIRLQRGVALARLGEYEAAAEELGRAAHGARGRGKARGPAGSGPRDPLDRAGRRDDRHRRGGGRPRGGARC